MGSREANIGRRPTVCTLILDKADNERAVALLHSPSSASTFQRPFYAITAADGRWHLSYSCESETRYLRPARLFFAATDDVWRKLTLNALRDISRCS